jgi:hypothetical protein
VGIGLAIPTFGSQNRLCQETQCRVIMYDPIYHYQVLKDNALVSNRPSLRARKVPSELGLCC